MAGRSHPWHSDTSWDAISPVEPREGVRYRTYLVGQPGDETAPLVMLAELAPKFEMAAHSHAPDYSEIILEGAERVGRRWYCPGDIRIVKGGSVYGPITCGPEGVKKLIVYRDKRINRLSIDESRSLND